MGDGPLAFGFCFCFFVFVCVCVFFVRPQKEPMDKDASMSDVVELRRGG